MAEKSAKKKPKKAAKAEDSVLGNLSATRPTRLGGERRAGAARASAEKTAAATTPSAPAKRAAAKPKASTAKASAPRTADAKAAKLREPAPAPPSGWQAPEDENGRRKSGPPRGAEIVTTAVQAAGELAQIGATVGGQLLKRATRRIPRR